jgi:hypothetical protein
MTDAFIDACNYEIAFGKFAGQRVAQIGGSDEGLEVPRLAPEAALDHGAAPQGPRDLPEAPRDGLPGRADHRILKGAEMASKGPRLSIVRCDLDEANAFVKQHHRHHGKVVGHKFSLAVADDEGRVRGVAIVSRPVARMLDDGLTLEVTRLASDGCPNACSALYAAAWRAARSLGWQRLVTYTLASEPGVSLHAAGWTLVGETTGGSWDRSNRPRVDKHPTQAKFRWEAAAKT